MCKTINNKHKTKIRIKRESNNNKVSIYRILINTWKQRKINK